MLCCLFCKPGPAFCREADDCATLSHKPERSPASRDRFPIAAGLLATKCKCTKQCAYVLRQHVPDIVDRVKDARETLHDVGRKRSTARLFDTLATMRASPKEPGGKYLLRFVFSGVVICGHVWCWLHGVNMKDSRMKKVFAALRRGDNEWVVKPKVKTQGWRGIWCSGWMRRHVQKLADFNPVTMTADLDPEPLEVHACY